MRVAMSLRLAVRVFESALPSHLKLTAGALALKFAADDGTGIYPSREYVAWLTGKDVRQVTRHLTTLVKLGVFVAVTPRSGGKGLTTHYRLDVEALPPRPRWMAKSRRSRPPADCANLDTDVQLSAGNVDTDVHVSPANLDTHD